MRFRVSRAPQTILEMPSSVSCIPLQPGCQPTREKYFSHYIVLLYRHFVHHSMCIHIYICIFLHFKEWQNTPTVVTRALIAHIWLHARKGEREALRCAYPDVASHLYTEKEENVKAVSCLWLGKNDSRASATARPKTSFYSYLLDVWGISRTENGAGDGNSK